MFRKLYYLSGAFAVMLYSVSVHAQDSLANKKPEMADALRANGKIYVVVAVLVTILLGLLIYVITLDRKIGKLEKGRKDT
ncbi:MAG TPA: hypothetical protein VMH01_11900 [Puia sp.]|nr:hypothetical protein [Puia sp.]